MTEHADLFGRRNRGWPWPEDSWGLSPMFGGDGWCHACGVPRHEQTGFLTLQRKSMRPEGAWMPYWRYDVLCVGADLARQIRERFDVELRPVRWHASSPGDAFQIVVPVVGERWFEPEALEEKALEHHGRSGAKCPVCGVWRWMPLSFGKLPPVEDVSVLHGRTVAASPEWFGDGWTAFRQLLIHRDLAELIAASSPRDFIVKEPRELAGHAGTDPVWRPGGQSQRQD